MVPRPCNNLNLKTMDSERTNNWGGNIALYIIGAVLIVGFLAYLWHKSANEKAQLGVGIANLQGRINAIEPVVTAQGNNLFSLNGVMASTVQGVKDMKECFGYDIAGLNDAVFTARTRSGGCGNREFKQSQTYNLASTTVTVDDTCRG